LPEVKLGKQMHNGMTFDEPIRTSRYLPLSILKRIALLPRSFRLTYAQTRLPYSNVRFAYLGEGESFLYIKGILGIDEFDRTANIPIWRIGNAIRNQAGSGVLLCVELNRLIHPLVPDGCKLMTTFPWVRQRVYLAGEAYKRRMQKIDGSFGRKVRKYQYDFRVVHDAASIDTFYQRLYLPYVIARFGNACHARRKGEIERAIKRGFLLQVLRGDLWVAGVACVLGNNQISAIAFGHLPEDTYPLRLGGLSTAYYYLIDFAANHSIACVDLLRSRPNLKDGVYCHKQRWGAMAEMDPWPHTAIRFIYPKSIPLPEPISHMLEWNGHEFRQIS
jgi:hypothetical protein